MASTVEIWLSWPGDLRAVRDFFYDAAKCDRYQITPTEDVLGPPDDEVREVYGVSSETSTISILRSEAAFGRQLRTNVHVENRLADAFTNEPWRADAIEACLRWLFEHEGDALVASHEVPIVMRTSEGIFVNDDKEALSWLAPWHMGLLTDFLDKRAGSWSSRKLAPF